MIGERAVRVGAYVTPGSKLLAVVPLKAAGSMPRVLRRGSWAWAARMTSPPPSSMRQRRADALSPRTCVR